MANTERGEVDLVVDKTGKTYTLFLSTNALCDMQQRTKRTYGELLGAIMALDVVALREMMRAVLQKHHAKDFVKDESIGHLIDSVSIKKAKDAMTELFTLNMPSDDDKPKGGDPSTNGNPPDAQDGTGDSST